MSARRATPADRLRAGRGGLAGPARKAGHPRSTSRRQEMEERIGTGPMLSSGTSPGTREKTTTETDSLVSPDRLWNVVVWNDPT
jgi:hypothetical protein